MSNNEINIDDVLPPKKDGIEKFASAETRVPEFLKEAAYEPNETRIETIKRDYERLIHELSDYVLAEQLTERELIGMGKPVAENYSAYFHETLGEVKKNRKKGEQRLFKLIPQHSQLDSKAFFETVHEQNDKEKEAKERAMELYPRAGVAKMDLKDDARKSLKKEAAGKCAKCGAELVDDNPDMLCGNCRGKINAAQDAGADETMKKIASCTCTDDRTCNECQPRVDAGMEDAPKWTAPEAQKGGQTNYEDTACTRCKEPISTGTGIKVLDDIFCGKCHDAGYSAPMIAEAPAKPTNLPPVSTTTGPMQKEAAAKWKAGTELEAKHNGAPACVAYVNDEDKTYVIKVAGTMYPSYYAFDDAHDTFNAVKSEPKKEVAEGLS